MSEQHNAETLRAGNWIVEILPSGVCWLFHKNQRITSIAIEDFRALVVALGLRDESVLADALASVIRDTPMRPLTQEDADRIGQMMQRYQRAVALAQSRAEQMASNADEVSP